MVAKFLILSALLYGSVAAGYVARKKGWAPAGFDLRAMRFSLMFVSGPVVLLVMWALDLERTILALPIHGFCLFGFLTIVSAAVARRMFSDPKARGAFVGCATFSNNGSTMGAFIAYLVLGSEQALALGCLYALSTTVYFFTVGFTVARGYASARGAQRPTLGHNVRTLLTDPVSAIPLAGLAAGLILNATGIERPAVFGTVVPVLTGVTVVLVNFAIGFALTLTSVRTHWRTGLLLGAVKFLFTPAVAACAVWVLAVHVIGTDTEAKTMMLSVLLIQSAMPVGNFAVMLARLCGLDVKIATAAWIMTTLAVPVVVPPIIWLLLRIV